MIGGSEDKHIFHELQQHQTQVHTFLEQMNIVNFNRLKIVHLQLKVVGIVTSEVKVSFLLEPVTNNV